MIYEEILSSLLSRVPADVDTREGSVIYLALAPVALEIADLYAELEQFKKDAYSDTATGNYLELKTKERGITRKAATKATRKGTFDCALTIGDRFGINGVSYAVTELISTAAGIYYYKLECEQAGVIGNTYTGDLLPLQYIEGLKSASITEVLVPGTDIESDESLRARFDNSFESEAFGGNRRDYIEKMLSISGVGGCKPYRAWNGGGTVKLVFLTSEYKKPSSEFVEGVQTTIDPTVNTGDGMGLAPMDHMVTVVGVDETTVNISMTITYQDGWTWDDVKPYAEAAIDDYFIELGKTWADSTNLIVRISKIEMTMLSLPGVIDITGTTINGAETNLQLAADNIPVRGSLSG